MSANKRAVKVVASLGMLVIAGLVTAWSLHTPSGGRTVASAYYMDVKTGQVFIARKELPPVAAPSGAKDAQGNGTGVLAFEFSCGNCKNEADRFMGFLASTDPAQVEPERREKLLLNMSNPALLAIAGPKLHGVVIASPGATDKWIPCEAAEAKQIESDVDSHCKQGSARGKKLVVRPCLP